MKAHLTGSLQESRTGDLGTFRGRMCQDKETYAAACLDMDNAKLLLVNLLREIYRDDRRVNDSMGSASRKY